MAVYCTQTLAGIGKDCSANKGGIREAFICNYKEGIFQSASGTVTGITSGVTFYPYVFNKNTGYFTSTLNVSAENGINYVSSEINLVFARMESVKRAEIAALSLGDLAMVIKDANNIYWAFGAEEAIRATAGSGQTGTARTDANQYSITFTDESDTYPMPLSEEAVEALLAAVEDSTSIGG